MPVELMHSAEDVVLPNGRRLVAETKVLYEGQGDMTLPATPWYLTPMMIACLILALSLIVAYLSLRRKKIYRAVYMVWFTMIGMAGVLVAFMVIVSQHEATSPNVMIWWLNPLAFIVPAMVWKKGVNKVLSIYMLLNASMLLGLVIGIMIGNQSINPAVVPLMLTTIVLSAAYFIVASKSFMQIKVSKQ